MKGDLAVHHLGGDKFRIDVRGHQLTVDQPADVGGEDSAPTPTELVIAGLASCIAFYARRYLARHDIPVDGLAISTSYALGGKPARVTDIDVQLTPPAALPVERRDGFLAVASHCTIHNTFREPPEIAIKLLG